MNLGANLRKEILRRDVEQKVLRPLEARVAWLCCVLPSLHPPAGPANSCEPTMLNFGTYKPQRRTIRNRVRSTRDG